MSALLTPELLRRLEQVQMLAARRAKSSLKGERRSRARGQNLGFQGQIHQDKIPQFRFLRWQKPKAISRGLSRSVAQPGRALLSGSRGRRFESCHSDHDFSSLSIRLATKLQCRANVA